MRKRTRHFIAIFLTLTFIASAPLVVLYTKGYRYNWKKYKVEKTGILRIETEPAGAHIFINGEPRKQRTSASFFRLLPEDYRVELRYPGCLNWEKTLAVNSGETTFARGVRLILDDIPTLSSRLDAGNGVFSPDGDMFAFLRTGDDWMELGTYDTETDKERLLARFGSDKYSDMEMEWSPTGRYLLLGAVESGRRRMILYRTDEPYGVIPLYTILPPRQTHPHWSGAGDMLTVNTNAGSYSFDPSEGRAEPLTLSMMVQDVILEGDNLFVLRRSGEAVTLERARKDSLMDAQTILSIPDGKYSFVKIKNDRVLISDDNTGDSLLIDASGGRILGKYPANRLSLKKGAGDWSRALLWNDFEIYTLNAETGERTLLTRVSTPLTDAQRLPESDMIIYSTDSSITVIEEDPRGDRVTYDLISFSSVNGFWLDRNGRSMLFMGAVGNQRGIYERKL